MSKTLVRIFGAVLLVALAATTIFGQGGMLGGRWWNRPQLARQLGLQRGQPVQIDSVFHRHSSAFRTQRQELAEQDEQLKRLLSQEPLDRERILRQIDAVEQARFRMAKQRALMLFEIRQILTLDQWNRLQAMNDRQQMNRGRAEEPPSSDQ